MRDLKWYGSQIASIVSATDAIYEAAGDNDLTDEQRAAVTANRERIERLRGEERELAATYAAAKPVAGSILEAPGQPAAGGITAVKDLAEERPWSNLGEFGIAVYRQTMGMGSDARLFKAAATGMGEAIGSDGGFAVPMEFVESIEMEMWETGQILSRVSERPIQGDSISFVAIDETSRADGSRRGGVVAYWVDEGVAPDPSQMKLTKYEMKLRKVGALGYMTDELVQDAPALAAELEEAFREEVLFEVEDAVVNGLGVGQPLGVLKSPALVTVDEETGQSPDSIDFLNIQAMWTRMQPRRRANAVWLINPDLEAHLNQMTISVGTGGVPVYLPPGGLSVSPYGTLMGRPVIPTEYNPAIGEVGDIILADFSRYRLIRKTSGPEFASSMHVRFAQGEQTFRVFYRVDGQPIPRSAITLRNSSNTVSPFVTLAAR